jgi:hypothetical protein
MMGVMLSGQESSCADILAEILANIDLEGSGEGYGEGYGEGEEEGSPSNSMSPVGEWNVTIQGTYSGQDDSGPWSGSFTNYEIWTFSSSGIVSNRARYSSDCVDGHDFYYSTSGTSVSFSGSFSDTSTCDGDISEEGFLSSSLTMTSSNSFTGSGSISLSGYDGWGDYWVQTINATSIIGERR